MPTVNASFRVAVLTSDRVPGLEYLLRHPDRGREWEIAGVAATDPRCRERKLLEKERVPYVERDLTVFCRARSCSRTDLKARGAFDAATLAYLRAWRADLVLLVGYRYLVTAPLIDAFTGRMINLHDGDTTIRGPHQLPVYRGLHATRDAIFDGVPETRSTAHLVTAQMNAGPVLARSWAFPVHAMVEDARRVGAADILNAYAYAQREWMMRMAWGPLLLAVVRGYAAHSVRVLDGRVFVGGTSGPVDLPPPAVLEGFPLRSLGAAS